MNNDKKSLAEIPISELFQTHCICALCGNDLPLDTMEKNIDGGMYIVCKDCAANKLQYVEPNKD